MEYTRLGRTGIRVSRLCLGTGSFGPFAREQDGFEIMDAALDHGINFFDTADVYGSQPGESEEIIGRWFAQHNKRRDKVVLATKLRSAMGEWPNMSGYSKLHIRQACEASLRRLQTDHIDLYQAHAFDPETPFDEFWEGMETLVRQGKVLYTGSSNFAAFQIARANNLATGRHLMGFVSEQCRYNLMSRMIEIEIVPACHEYGMAILPWSPRQGGLLSGGLSEATEGRRATESMQKKSEQRREQLQQYEELCDKIGDSPGDVAVAWLLGRPGVTSPILGPRTASQLVQSLRALEIRLSDETLTRLDEIFPARCSEAPEGYIHQAI